MTILCEIFLDLLPTYTTFFFNLFIGEALNIYVGHLITFCVNAEAAICAFYYWRMFSRCPSPSEEHTKKKTPADLGGLKPISRSGISADFPKVHPTPPAFVARRPEMANQLHV